MNPACAWSPAPSVGRRGHPASGVSYSAGSRVIFDGIDIAVARGAAYYGMVRRGEGVRIAAGLARTYYVGVERPEANASSTDSPLPLSARDSCREAKKRQSNIMKDLFQDLQTATSPSHAALLVIDTQNDFCRDEARRAMIPRIRRAHRFPGHWPMAHRRTASMHKA